MPSSATPVQLVDPATGVPYRSGSSGSTVAQAAYTKDVGSDSISTGQVAVTTSATQVVPARTGRVKTTLTPTSSTVFYVGGSGVSATNGLYVPAGASVTLDTSAAIFAVGSAALTVSFIEFY